jgi:MraZ protein
MSLRGSYSARIDDRSRVKVPAEFRRVIQDTWGSDLFVTSFTGDDIFVYPLPVWEREFEARMLALPPMDPARRKIQKVVNYFGQSQTLDAQGRVVLHSPLKERAEATGEVMVLGYGNHLVIQNAEAVKRDVEQSIEADLEELSKLWRIT